MERAKRAPGRGTMRATIERALRRGAEAADHLPAERVTLQRAHLSRLTERIDVPVLVSEEMWR